MLPQIQLKPKNISITEQYSPSFKRNFSKRQNNELSIQKNYSSVKGILDELDTIVSNRMQIHEQELIKVMKKQITKMLQDIKKVIKVYNSMILEKNLSQDLWETKNEADFFKHQAVRLFQENNCLKKQIFELRKIIQAQTINDNCQAQALKNMAKKLHKVKLINSTYRHKRNQSLITQTNETNMKIKTQISDIKNPEEFNEGKYSVLKKNDKRKRLARSNYKPQKIMDDKLSDK